jgi:Flp pilus assembly protein TadD
MTVSQPHKSRIALDWLAPALIALAALTAYADSLTGSFVLDDRPSIAANPSIRHLWPPIVPLSPPAGDGLTVEGRPVLNLSLALNYAFGGLDPRGYHAVNLLVHLLAGLALFGLVRRTLERIGCLSGDSRLVAFAAALLWTVHPLQTESVAYVVQRAESLMGLFYLLTLYGFVRYAGVGSPRPAWAWLAVACCYLGMATKEVMVSAPVMVVLYDRTFVSGSLREAWRRHGRVFSWMAGSWILLGWLVWREGSRGGTSGFSVGVGPLDYWLSQIPAIARYLRLAAWPGPLVFDYGMSGIRGNSLVWPEAALIAALAVGSGWALLASAGSGVRALGFAGTWFFAILAPTSLVPGNRQTLAEHRMYLALAPIAVLAAAGLFRLAETVEGKTGASGRIRRLALALCLVLGAGLGCLTARRNLDYRNDLALFSDTVAKVPDNPYAQDNLGMALMERGRTGAAASRFEEALRLKPDDAVAESDLGNALLQLDQPEDAVGHLRAALRLVPDSADAHINLGAALMRLGLGSEAAAEFQAALRIRPDDAEAHNNLGGAWASSGRLADAITQFGEAIRLDPGYAAARENLKKAELQIQKIDNQNNKEFEPLGAGAHR